MTALVLGRLEDPHQTLAFYAGRVFRLDGTFDAEEDDLANDWRHAGMVFFPTNRVDGRDRPRVSKYRWLMSRAHDVTCIESQLGNYPGAFSFLPILCSWYLPWKYICRCFSMVSSSLFLSLLFPSLLESAPLDTMQSYTLISRLSNSFQDKSNRLFLFSAFSIDVVNPSFTLPL